MTPQQQQIANEFLQKTNNLTASGDAFDSAYDWLSEMLPEFADFESVCMFLGLA